MTTLQTFVVEAVRSFQFLRTDYGFSPPEERGEGYWRSLRYQTAVTEVLIRYEIGTLPSLSISRLQLRGTELLTVESLDLDFLFGQSGERPFVEVWHPRDVSDDRLSDRLAHLAEGLRRHGGEFLRGNFAGSWPTLVARQRLEYEQRVARTIELEEARQRR